MHTQRSLIVEVERAIASRSPERRVEALRRVTDLFMIGAEDYSESQVDVFDEVISRLAERIEVQARVELARRLAPVKNAPTGVVRNLAGDTEIEVAGPVLRQSARLTDDDLLTFANGSDQQRLLAISQRASISEAVSDVLVTRGDREVVRSVVRNEGARFSSAGYGRLVQQSIDDEELAVSVGVRKDIPKEHLHALVTKASEAVYRKLAASNPEAVGEVHRVLHDLTGLDAGSEPKPLRDYTRAQGVVDAVRRSGQSFDHAVQEFAKSGKFEETVVALAARCRLPIEAVERVMTDTRMDTDLALILAKAANLSWPTARLILELGRGGTLSALDAETANRHYDRLQPSTAQRVVRFFQVRQSAGDKAN